MIVRDEAAVIARCIESARPYVDRWVIADTGSTDATTEIVSSALAGVPGELHRHDWVDFGYNRSELLALALRGCRPGEYLLLIDADMTIEVRAPLPELSADAYLVRHDEPVAYAIPRVIRNVAGWRYAGATHEYLARDGEYSRAELPELVVHHHGDGASRGAKLERDRRLLEAELAGQPDDERTLFYLAQTERDAGNDERARALYARRAALGGWDEEAYYAAFQAALLIEGEDPARAVDELRRATAIRPSRPEALCEAARILREAGRHEEAYATAAEAAAIPAPEKDLLFVHRDVAAWRARLELGAAAWWTGRYEEALAINEDLLAEDDLPPAAARVAEENRGWALGSLGREAPPLRQGRRLRLEDALGPAEVGEVVLETDPRWPAFNPSIAASPSGGFLLAVRTANYRVDRGVYTFLDGTDSVRTVNYLARLDDDLGLLDVEPIVDRAGADSEPLPTAIRGYEDLRLLPAGDRLLGLAAVRDRVPSGRCRVAMLELDGASIESVSVLAGPDRARDEKNWMPFTRDGEPHAVRLLSPLDVRALDVAEGEATPVREGDTDERLALARGGSQGVRVDGGWLFVVHDVLQLGRPRRYSHRLLLLGDDLSPAALGPAFTFTGAEVEHCCGMARRGSDLVLSFGVEDRAAALAVVAEGTALSTLEPLAGVVPEGPV